jgi:hypothetical protein
VVSAALDPTKASGRQVTAMRAGILPRMSKTQCRPM